MVTPLRPLKSVGLVLSGLALVLAFAAPMVFGLSALLQAAAGHGPELWQDPRWWPALSSSVFSGVLATGLVLLLTLITLIHLYTHSLWRTLQRVLVPILALPHAALAVALLFLFAPGGWLLRLTAALVPGMDRPPLGWVMPDSLGLWLALGLVLKEAPFLVWVAAAQLERLDVDAALRIGASLGYSKARCWWRLIVPQLLPLLRYPLWIILSFNLAVVDMAMVLGPDRPPTAAVLLLQWWQDVDTRTLAASGALQLLLVSLMLGLIIEVLFRGLARVCAALRINGDRGREAAPLWGAVSRGCALGWPWPALWAMVLLLVYSVAWRWAWPDLWPSDWSLAHWQGQGSRVWRSATITLALALATAMLSLCTAILWLELERVGRWPRIDALWLLPLLLSPPALWFGWQSAIGGTEWPRVLKVLHAHWLLAFPYCFLVLAVPWRNQDPLWRQSGVLLGRSYLSVLWRVRLPLLRQSIARVLAIALAVSVAQYLPTLVLGGGRVATLTLDLMASQGGGDMRHLAVLAWLQAALPLLAFGIATRIPAADSAA